MCYNRANHHQNWKNHHHRRHMAKKWWKEQMQQQFGYPPVNVEELEDRYEINIYAAGYSKEAFKVGLKGNILKISADKPSTSEKKSTGYGRFQFQPSGFERRFELNEKINKELIIAEYENGVLTVTLPKLAEYETFQQDIEIK